jgi:hypothetical protein
MALPARSGAFQPATSPGPTVIRVGSFNIGVEQSMLTGKSTLKRVAKVEEMIATCVQEGSLISTQPDVQDNVPQERTRTAQRCRDALRGAEHLARKRVAGRNRFSQGEQQMLKDLDSGALLLRANAATRASGHGRLKNADGTFQDIGAHTGGLARTVLDDWKPPVLEDEEVGQEDAEDAGLQEDEPVCWPTC